MAIVLDNIVAYYDPKSPTTEAFRSLRTNIQFMTVSQKTKLISFTSTTPSEGKSFIVGNLGVVTAASNKKTLLIDCDLRRSGLSRLFGIHTKEGLSNALSLKTQPSYEELPLYDTGVENLAVLPSGIPPPNPSELLETDTVDKIFAIAREKFDIVYIDVPPVLSVTDSVIVAKKSDSVILVVAAGFTSVNYLKRSHSILKKSGANIIGTVLNKVDTGIGGYYGKYGYYYGGKE